jgi:tetratricopeptide (TPR) repeat protein
VGRTLIGIGWNMYEVSQYEEARSCYDRALVILEKNFGGDHYEVANILNNIALILVAEGDYERAVPLYERALKIDAENLPPDHPFLLEVLEGYSGLLRTMGRDAEAEALPARAEAMREEAEANSG